MSHCGQDSSKKIISLGKNDKIQRFGQNIFMLYEKKWTTVDCMFNQLASVSKFCMKQEKKS